jgi:hypothetical protein
MNYQAHYDRLMWRAQNRVLSGYSERHHIVPRCLGGSKHPDNVVRLTPEEHYIAHQLLVKLHPENFRLVWAAAAMAGATQKMAGRANNKLHGWLRRRFAEQIGKRNKGRKMPPGFGAAVSARQLGSKRKPHSEESKRKTSAAMKGRTFTEEHKAKLAAAKLGKRRGPFTEEHSRRMSESQKRAWVLRRKRKGT